MRLMDRLLSIRNHLFQREIFPRINESIGKPSTVHISITDRCNLNCRMCDIWRKPKKEELATEQWKKIITELRKWLGPFSLKIAGGEPLMRKDLLELLSFSHNKGIFTGISTNATLIDDKTAESLVRAGLDEVHISLDSVDKEEHDALRGRKGTFDDVQRAIGSLEFWKEKLGSKMTINLACVINKNNLHRIKDLVKLTEDKKLHSINFQPLYQNFGAEYDPVWFKKSPLWPEDLKMIDEMIDFLIQKRRAGFVVGNKVSQLEAIKVYFHNPGAASSMRCKAGTKDIAFDAQGKMLLCFNLPPIGDSQKRSPKDIWNSREAKRRRKDIAGCKRNCNLLNCNFDE